MGSRERPSRSEALDNGRPSRSVDRERARGREGLHCKEQSTNQSSEAKAAEDRTGVSRRAFLAGAVGVSGLVGASAGAAVFLLDDRSDSGPAAIAEEFLEALENGSYQEASRLLHTHSPWSDARAAAEAIEPVDGQPPLEGTTLAATGVSTATFAEHTNLDSGTAERIARGTETALVEATYGPALGTRYRQSVVTLALATDDGDWRVVRNEAEDDDDGSVITALLTPRDERIPQDIHVYLIENEVAGYDGTLTDRTGRDTATIRGGAGNGLAFDPVVVLVDAGTEITWEWTGQGGVHNVRVTDGPAEFESTLTDEAGHTFSQTLSEPGNYLYTCAPHQELGMRGVIIVR